MPRYSAPFPHETTSALPASVNASTLPPHRPLWLWLLLGVVSWRVWRKMQQLKAERQHEVVLEQNPGVLSAAEIRERLATEIARILARADVREMLSRIGFDSITRSFGELDRRRRRFPSSGTI